MLLILILFLVSVFLSICLFVNEYDNANVNKPTRNNVFAYSIQYITVLLCSSSIIQIRKENTN